MSRKYWIFHYVVCVLGGASMGLNLFNLEWAAVGLISIILFHFFTVKRAMK